MEIVENDNQQPYPITSTLQELMQAEIQSFPWTLIPPAAQVCDLRAGEQLCGKKTGGLGGHQAQYE